MGLDGPSERLETDLREISYKGKCIYSGGGSKKKIHLYVHKSQEMLVC
jgi:hypothetical protein